ncbi:MAG: hypothetical protein E6Q97_26495 [Desulfurellales bacterium]|nr:MAG: hypothetical protein E6Q97_26495 [Desulfurellales bacterium]
MGKERTYTTQKLTLDEMRKQREELLFLKAKIEEKVAAVKRDNPYWYYEPTTGNVSDERKNFLRSFIEESDMPTRFYGGLDVHQSEAPIRGASGGNQSSKTTTGCIEAFMMATGTRPYVFDEGSEFFRYRIPEKRWKRKDNAPKHVRVIGEDYQNGILRNLLPTYRYWAPKEFLIDGSWEKSYSAEKQTLTMVDNATKRVLGTIEFMSNKQDLGTFAGPPRHKLILDEEPRHDVYKENLMRFTTADELDVLFCMTPDDGMTWTAEMATATEQEGKRVDWFKIPSVCNPYANLNVLREIVQELPYDERRMRLLGEHVSLSGLVYGKEFDARIHMIKPFDTDCNCGRGYHADDCPVSKYLFFLGVDPHTVKPSCAALCFIDREGNFYVDTCYKRKVTVDELKRDLANLTKGKRVRFSVVDPSSDSSMTVYGGLNIWKMLTRGESRLISPRKGEKYAGSINAGVQAIKQRLMCDPVTNKPRFFIFNRPENADLRKSFETLQRDSYNNEDAQGIKDKIRETWDDHHACVRYINQFPLNYIPQDRPDMATATAISEEDLILL